MVKADLESKHIFLNTIELLYELIGFLFVGTRNDLIDVKQSFAQMRTDLMKQIEGEISSFI